MPFCTNCGTSVLDGGKFCPNCGNALGGAARIGNRGYGVLGIPENSSADEIKKAYRQLAVKYHPDKNPGDASAAEKFREVTDACKTLLKAKEDFMPFCTNCGADITEDLRFCLHCGIALGGVRTSAYQQDSADTPPDIPQVMYTLSKREALCSVYWIITAAIQVLSVPVFGFICLITLDTDRLGYVLFMICLLINNFHAGFRSLKFSKIIMSDYPVGMMGRYGENSIKQFLDPPVTVERYGRSGLAMFLLMIGFNALFCIWNAAAGNLLFTLVCGMGTVVAIIHFVFVHNFARNSLIEIEEYVSQFE